MVTSRRASGEHGDGRSATTSTETAREWGQRMAQQAPNWSEEKWQRVATLLGVRFTHAGMGNDDAGESEL